MIIAVDSGVLMHLIDPDLPTRPDPTTGLPTEDCARRVQYLIERVSRASGRLVIPTPVLAEVLVKAGPAGQEWLAQLSNRRAVRVAPFDEMAAVECAAMANERALRNRSVPRGQAKFDEQIVAIAIVENCDEIVADDDYIARIAPESMKVTRLADLPLPPEDPQGSLL